MEIFTSTETEVSRSGFQQLTTICDCFADMCDLKFNTDVNVMKSKTKCVIFFKTVSLHSNTKKIL